MGLWTGENASIYHFYQPIPELCGWSSGFLGRYPMSIGWGGGGSLYHTQLFQTLKSDFSALLDDPGGPLVRSSTCCNALMHGAGAHHTLWQLCPHPQLPQRPKDTLTILLLPQAPSKPFRVTGPIQLTSLSPQLISLKPVSITVEGSDNT